MVIVHNILVCIFCYVADELEKLADSGMGRYISQQRMKEDSGVPAHLCTNVFLKPVYEYVPESFWRLVVDPDLDQDTYDYYYRVASKDETIRRIVLRYHPHREILNYSQPEGSMIQGTSSPPVKAKRIKQGPVIKTAVEILEEQFKREGN